MDWVDFGIKVGVIIVIAVVVSFILHRAIRRAVTMSSKRQLQRAAADGRLAFGPAAPLPSEDARAAATLVASGISPEQRAANRTDTLSHGLNLLVDWIIGIVVVLSVLTEANLRLTPLLTSAGIGGIIVALGAQSLIRDFIAGIFLVLEEQYGVGDVIDTGQVRGVVQEIGSRVTRLQSADGEIWYIRNGDISTLGNQSQGWLTSDVDIAVPAGRDPAEVIATLRQVAATLDADPAWRHQMLRPPEVLGLTSFDTEKMIFTIQVTGPQPAAVENELRARAIAALASSNNNE